jgi:hypothetical protein
MMGPKPDIAGIISGTVLAGGATIWLLNEFRVIQADDIGLTVALLLVLSGIVGLAASQRS